MELPPETSAPTDAHQVNSAYAETALDVPHDSVVHELKEIFESRLRLLCGNEDLREFQSIAEELTVLTEEIAIHLGGFVDPKEVQELADLYQRAERVIETNRGHVFATTERCLRAIVSERVALQRLIPASAA